MRLLATQQEVMLVKISHEASTGYHQKHPAALLQQMGWKIT